MRVLQINNIYGRLSTGKIVADLHHAYQNEGIESYVCYGRGPTVQEKGVYKFSWEFYAKMNKLRGRATGILYSGCFVSTLRLIDKIEQIQPDVIHLHCINDDSANIYMLLNYLKRHEIPTIVTLHAEFFHTGSCGHAYACNQWISGCRHCEQYRSMHMLCDRTEDAWKRMQEAFSGFKKERLTITAVSPWLEERAARSEILGGYNHSTILNAVDNKHFYRRETTELRESLQLEPNRKIALFVTSDLDSATKGGEYLVELANTMPDYRFIVLGMPGKRRDIPSNIIRVGRIYDQDLVAQYYSMADVTLVLSKAETFSMPTAESLCCGTPVVGFLAGGPETICIPTYSSFTEYGDVNKLIDSIGKHQYDSSQRKIISEAGCRKYSITRMKEKYVCEYINVTKGL